MGGSHSEGGRVLIQRVVSGWGVLIQREGGCLFRGCRVLNAHSEGGYNMNRV